MLAETEQNPQSSCYSQPTMDKGKRVGDKAREEVLYTRKSVSAEWDGKGLSRA